MSGYITVKNGRLHYLKFGSGKRLLLCFHGYANSASIFASFDHYLAQDFTLISVDLPYHGGSEWKSTTLLHREDLRLLVQHLKQQHGVGQLSLMGYSMGGRVCLTITELMPESVDQLLLIASDGLVFNPLYFLVTKTFFGKRLFRSFLSQPARYTHYIDWMRSRKWIDESRYKFAMYYLGSDRDRNFLLNVWRDMSLIVPNMKKLKAVVRRNNIPIYMFMGSYDRVIPVRNAWRFMEGIPSARLYVLEKGHRVFDSDTMPQMAQCLISGTC